MASYIYLELDTTPPEIEIYAPSYTTTDVLNEIVINSVDDKEIVSHEIYVIDSNGNRHDYTFQKSEDGTQYIGIVVFSLFPIGMTTIYAQMTDDVGNISNIVERSFEIKESLTTLVLNIEDKQYENTIKDSDMNIETIDKSMIIDGKDGRAKIETNDKSMDIEISESDRGVESGSK